MSNRRARSLIYMLLFVMVAVDRTACGAAIFLAFMDFVEA